MAAPRRIAACALVALWVLQEARFIVPSSTWIDHAGVAGLLVYFGAAFIVSQPALRVVVALVTLSAVGVAIWRDIPLALVDGARSAILFSAFLAAMQLLKVSLEVDPRMHRLRSHHSALDAGQQHDSLMLRTHLVGAIFGAGGLAVVSPILAPERPRDQRTTSAESALQGLGLAVLWSPFFVAMAVCTRLLAGIALGPAVLNGVAMGAIGLVLSHGLYGGRIRSAWLTPLFRALVETLLLAAAIVAFHEVWGIGNLEAVVIGVPVLALVIARHALRAQAMNLAARWCNSLEAIAAEALVVGAALVLGEVLKALLAQGVIGLPAGTAAWPLPVLLLMPTVLMLLTSLIGLHPIISASLLLPLLGSVNTLHPVVAAGSVLLGWMMCVVLSRFVVPVMYAAGLFGVSSNELVRGRNLRFCALYVPFALVYLWILNAVLTHSAGFFQLKKLLPLTG
ncbi:hypothetical protein [Variovorax sp. PBL-E5]|uniref:hypothetical protein n=1 Tax=Variovorax sp. PBL-E5 TaxID=434014 RepID=UPI001318042F|nr:hypothetical protein [Variovorax sp. PBL-E5]VTU38322.1 hypothetical protein E5CHR_04790 [Variovorax sp. PBL-E5]